MENEGKTTQQARQELSKRQQRQLNAAKNERAMLEVKVEAQRRILKGQRQTVISMENLLDELQNELIRAEEIIDNIYNDK